MAIEELFQQRVMAEQNNLWTIRLQRAGESATDNLDEMMLMACVEARAVSG